MVHHCFQHIRLFDAYFLCISTSCLRSGNDFGLGPGELVRILSILESSGLGLYFKHASARYFVFDWNGRHLPLCFTCGDLLRFLHLNWLLGGPVASLHMLLEFLIRHKLPATLFEWADKLSILGLLLSSFWIRSVWLLAVHSELFAAQFQHWLPLWSLTNTRGWLTCRINHCRLCICALLFFHIYQSISIRNVCLYV